MKPPRTVVAGHRVRRGTAVAATRMAAVAAILLFTSLTPPRQTRVEAAAQPTASPNTQPPAISGALTLASAASDGTKGDGPSDVPSISASGTAVAFTSFATNFDPSDTDSANDVYVKDLTTGDVSLASTSGSGVKGNSGSGAPSIAGSGTTVAFESGSTNLDPGDTDNVLDIYVKDLTTGDLTLASTSDTGTKGIGQSLEPSLSKAGNRVAFSSDSSNLDPADTDGVFDIFVKKLVTGDIVLASITRGGVKGDATSSHADISPNGKRVAFDTTADNLNSGDADKTSDVYVKILGTGKLILASTSDAGVKGTGVSEDPSLSTKGTKVAFSSSSNLDPGDRHTGFDVYVKNLSTGDIQLASTSDTGVNANGDSVNPVLSADGKRVAFASTATNLDPADTSNDWDVYVKDLVTGDISLASTSSDGVKGEGDFSLAGPSVSISGKGRFVAFDTLASLDSRDADSLPDTYVKEPYLCTIVGTSGDDTITGTPGNDVICGRDGSDTIDGAGGNDVVFGEGGDDVLLGGPGDDATDGGTGADTLDYSASANSVAIDLSEGTAVGGDATGDTFAGIENVQGSDYPDELTGDGGDNTLIGLGGDDVLAGGGGADTLSGLDGIDIVDYQTSPAAVAIDLSTGAASGGDATGDTLVAVEGIVGSPFDDTLTGDSGDNFFLGMAGADTIDGGAGTDLANYFYSAVGVTVNLTSGNTSGGDAKGDVLTGIENLAGSPFDDKLTGDDDPNVIQAGDGNDTLTGKGGDDTLLGQGGIDTFDGGGGTDTCDDVAGESVTGCEL